MRTAVATVILAHLAAAGLTGCPSNGAGSALTSPTPTTPGTAATTPPEGGSAAAGSGEAGLGATCRTDDDCRGELKCRLGFDGADFSETGECTDQPIIYEGRPLLVEGRAHVAPLGASTGWLEDGADVRQPMEDVDVRKRERWASLLTTAAQEEHASIPSFARALCMLVAVGAPAALVAKTQAAIGDEIRHAQICATWARRLGAEVSEPGPLAEALAPFPPEDQPGEALLDDVFWGGCIGESLAAHRMQARASTAPLADLADAMACIADDEARHAALAFETARWLVGHHPALRERLAGHITQFEATACPNDRSTLAPLLAVLG